MITRPVALTALGAAAATVLGAAGVVGGSGRRLGFDTVDPWLIVFALGLAVLFGAAAFGFHDIASQQTGDPEKRWERALGMWGVLTAGATVGFVLLGVASGFDTATAAGAIAITGLFECVLILGALIALVLGT